MKRNTRSQDLPNRCLGIKPDGKYCQVRLPLGVHFCDQCRKRIEKMQKKGIPVIIQGRGRKRSLSPDE